MTTEAFIGMLVGVIIALALIFWFFAPAITDNLPPVKLKSPSPSCCYMVELEDIEPPVNGQSALSLKREYMEAEDEMVDGHDPTMARKIRLEMAACLREGWPLDVAICQAAYCFVAGVCQCSTCKNLTNSTLA